MGPTFEEFMQSAQFTFFVGEEGTPIVVHAAAIAATSPQLDALMNGRMQESEKRCARIEDVSVGDFIRFCEYAYRGDYTVPSCDSKSQQEFLILAKMSKKSKMQLKRAQAAARSSVEVQESPIPEFDEPTEPPLASVPEPMPESLPEVKIGSRASLRRKFNKRSYLTDVTPRDSILKQFEPQPNKTADQDFSTVLLAHARLYCFANLRMIAPLKALTLSKLHKTLLGFKLFTERVGDIIELARYAYSNPDLPSREYNGNLDELRKLVVDYIVCEIDTIGENDLFTSYMQEGGEFVGDFWTLAKKYMA